MAEMYDLVVIGAGPGGYVAAIRAAQLGLKVACIEKRSRLGGTCLNIGCIPSKALLDSSYWYALARQQALASHGVRLSGVSLDLPGLLARKERIVHELTQGIAYLFKKYGVTSYHGSARLVGGHQVEVQLVESERLILEGRYILLATGSVAVELPFLPFDGQGVVSSTEALDFSKVPQHLLVIGAGYIGLELGSVWQRLGAEVTVLEALPRLLPQADGEVAAEVHKQLSRQGLRFHLQMRVTRMRRQGDMIIVTAQGPDGTERDFMADRILVAVGRKPCVEGLGLEQVGLRLDPISGRLPVDGGYRTAVPHIFAIGDLIAGPMLAHKASAEGVVVAERLAGMQPRLNYAAIPSVIYIHPEVASVGATEEQLQQQKIRYRVGRFPFLANGRAKALGESGGWVKVLADEATDRLLGVHIVGPQASELIAECATLMEFHASAEDVARCIHPHPSLSEALAEAARMAWCGKPLHL
ncbi:MAG: dihydrolipoyl dehydrogenase [Gemmataceae bacterium]|nr:dihydrolipoyl dehydrogenase [Gemmataceae bacterium]MCS7269491.1 dihydrolipoyl dehydrogenase [Gemmataceae bacterium]MDW8241900.1 dihydrolipoyl dehydrogenase [Thermogemmata sp.]